MLALRINRINGEWNAYWKALSQKSPAAANDNSPQKIATPHRMIAPLWIAPARPSLLL
jgi:hypothetical protein